ncbi:MAG: hypothetical protein OFPI_24430 [Osedax symbiont Rs2]|nr:MAG: hypothetical protein OFPI_24430 [Osedax symbiont Rs2]
MFLDVKDLNPQQCYQALVAAVIPRPIAWISTISASGVLNLAPYSFFTVASCQPLVLSVTQILPRDLQHKDTLTNLQQTGECVVNIVDQDAVELMNATCANFPADVDEFDVVAVPKVESKLVQVPGVAISPVRFECKLRQIITISDQPMGGSMMLLDVLAIHSADSCSSEQQILTEKINAVGKMGGSSYSTTAASFELRRPA